MTPESLSPLIRGPINRSHLQNYADASLDFNPIHLDDDFAKQAGFPSVIAHGMLSMAFMGDFIRTHFPQSSHRTLHFSCRFKKVVFPGDTLTIQGKLKEESKETSLKEITLQLTITNQKDEVVSQGEAQVEAL